MLIMTGSSIVVVYSQSHNLIANSSVLLIKYKIFWGGERMAAKKGTRYKCDDCGIVVMVEDECGCTACDLICCGLR